MTLAVSSAASGLSTPVPHASSLVGLVVVRGGGAPLVHRRLPRRASASVGRRDRHAFALAPGWVPRDLGTFTPVEDGWLFHNAARARMRVESDFIATGFAIYQPDAITMMQRGDHRISWEGLERPLGVSLTVRTRRLEDQRVPFAVDNIVDSHEHGNGSYLGVTDAPTSAALRYRLAVLFRHLIDGEPEPLSLLQKRAESLGMPEDHLAAAAHRYRRRLNVVRSLDLQSLEELGDYLVLRSQELTKDDLEP